MTSLIFDFLLLWFCFSVSILWPLRLNYTNIKARKKIPTLLQWEEKNSFIFVFVPFDQNREKNIKMLTLTTIKYENQIIYSHLAPNYLSYYSMHICGIHFNKFNITWYTFNKNIRHNRHVRLMLRYLTSLYSLN